MKNSKFIVLTLIALLSTSIWAQKTYTFDDGVALATDWTIVDNTESVGGNAICEIAAPSKFSEKDGNYLYFGFENKSKISITITSTASYSNISNISFDVVANDNSKPNFTLNIVDDSGNVVKNIYSEKATKADFNTGGTNKWGKSDEAISPAASGHVQLVLYASSSGKYAAIDNFAITYSAGEITPVAVSGVELSPTEVSVEEGKTATLTAIVLPADAANKNVTWSSSDDAVATVANGVVTGVAEGTATVTVKTEDGDFEATCAVTVTKKEEGGGGEGGDPTPGEGGDPTPGEGGDPTPGENENLLIKGTAQQVASGPAAGSVVTNLSKKDAVKLDKKKHFGVSLKDGFTLEEGDIFVINITTAADLGKCMIYADNEGSTLLYDEGIEYSKESPSATGEKRIILPAAAAGKTAIYLWREDGATQWNPTFSDIAIYRNGEIPVPEPIAVTGVSLNKQTAEVEIGKTITLTATIAPADAANKNVTWNSSDDAIATVANGVVTGVAEGTATVTVKTEDGGYEATCAVTVKKSEGGGGEGGDPTPGGNVYAFWRFSGTDAPAVGSSESGTKMKVEFMNDNDSKTFSTESAAYNTAVPEDMKSQGSKGIKLSGNALYLKVTIDGGFNANDVVYICGYNPWKISSTSAQEGDIAASVATGTSKTDYNIGSFTLQSAVSELYMKRADGSGTTICAIKVERGGSTPAEDVDVTGVTLNKTSAEINLGKTMQLTATVLPANATNKNVTWSSSANAIATVDENGKVTAVAEGTAIITVKTEDGGFEATCEVTVVDVPVIDVTGVSLDKTAVTIKVDETATLTATVQPADATDKEVTWSTSNASIATVTNGVVKGIAEGNAVITVKTQDGNFTATCTVKVEGKPIDLPTGITNRHEPEVYEKEKKEGGYNTPLTMFDQHEYEVFYAGRAPSNNIIAIRTTPVDKMTGIENQETATAKFCEVDGWLTAQASSVSSSASDAVKKDEFEAASDLFKMAGQSIVLYVKGYDQFSFYGMDKNVEMKNGDFKKNQRFQVFIDGTMQPEDQCSKEATIRRYPISTGEHLIEIKALADGESRFYALSLRVAQEPRTKHLDGNDTTQNIFKTKDLYPIRYFTKYNHMEGAETKLEWAGEEATGIGLQHGGRSAIGDTLIVSGTANCPAGEYTYYIVSSLNGIESSRVKGTFTVRTQLRAVTETDVDAYKDEAIETIEFRYYAFDEDIHFEWLNDQVPAGITTSQADQTFTISGTPTVGGTFQYRIAVEGGEEIRGTITVQDIDLGNNPVLYLYKNSQAYNDDGVYSYLREQGYNLIARKTQKDNARPAEQYAKYRWVLISEDADADNPEVLAVARGESNLPVLNMKAFSYAEGRLDWGAPNNGSLTKEGKSITVERADHPIFQTLNKKRGDRIQVLDSVIARGLMPTEVTYQNSLCLATALKRGTDYYSDGDAQTFIHEIPAEQRNGHKYLSLPIAISSSKRLTADGKSLVKAVVEYLLNDQPTVAIPQLEITGFIISSDDDDMKGLIDQTENTIHFEIDLKDHPSLDVKNVIPAITIADAEYTHVTPAIGTAIDISTSIYVPVEYVVSDFINRRVYELSAHIFTSDGLEEVYVAGQWVNIFDIYGRKITTTNEDIYTMDLPHGIYLIVTENGQTIKIMR